MRISSYNPQSRYRRRNSERMLAFFVVLGILMLAFGLGFWLGKKYVAQRDHSLTQRVEKLADEREALQDTVTELRAEVQTSQARYGQLQQTYKEVLPEGPLRDLTALLKQQLDEGRSAERLEFLIRSARPPRNCSDPETKRFVVTTPAYDGPSSQIALAEGRLVVSASGQSAVNGEGAPEAWYDPSKKVSVSFAVDGVKQSKTGVMPLRHSIVVENREYRLNVAEGAQSFAKVTFDSCDYP